MRAMCKSFNGANKCILYIMRPMCKSLNDANKCIQYASHVLESFNGANKCILYIMRVMCKSLSITLVNVYTVCESGVIVYQ